MGAAQITMLVLIGINLLLSAHLHGKLKEKQYHNFWLDAISLVILMGLLLWGGFFN